MKKIQIKYLIMAAVMAVFLFPFKTLAHSGRTDSSCFHNIYTSYCYGYYHCHNVGVIPSLIPPKTTPKVPEIKAWFKYKPNADGKTFDIEMLWSDITNTGFSLALYKNPGGNPGPLADTTEN